jgi:twitching motility protein PilT
MARIDSFLRLVVEQQASDLHFHAGKVPVIRHNGALVPLPFRAPSESEARRFLLEMLSAEEKATFDERQEIDLMYALEGVGRFRVNLFVQSHGPGAVFRVIPDRPPELDALGFPLIVRQLTQLTSGLVLIGGPTGAGKTTTLAAIVHEINKTQRRHIVTIEDPIEFLHEPIGCAITQRQVGVHTESFADAVRSAMRISPDVLVVGELRDFETAHLALQAAEAGALVFGTLHTNSATKTLARILDMAPDDLRDTLRQSLAAHLRAVLAQHLVRRRSGDGRVAALEVFVSSPAAATMIRDNKIFQLTGWLVSQPPDSGCQGLDACLLRYVKDGVIDLEEAREIAENKDALARAAHSHAASVGAGDGHGESHA